MFAHDCRDDKDFRIEPADGSCYSCGRPSGTPLCTAWYVLEDGAYREDRGGEG